MASVAPFMIVIAIPLRLLCITCSCVCLHMVRNCCTFGQHKSYIYARQDGRSQAQLWVGSRSGARGAQATGDRKRRGSTRAVPAEDAARVQGGDQRAFGRVAPEPVAQRRSPAPARRCAAVRRLDRVRANSDAALIPATCVRFGVPSCMD